MTDLLLRTVAQLPGTARCLVADNGGLLVGCEDRCVRAVSASTGAVETLFETPFLVSDLEATSDSLYLTLGPGHIAQFDRRRAQLDTEREVLGASVLARHGASIVLGGSGNIEAWAGRGSPRADDLKTYVAKRLYALALDEERAYCGFEDGTLRIFRRRDSHCEMTLGIGKPVKGVWISDDSVVTANGQGEIVVRDKRTYALRSSARHDPEGAPYGLLGLSGRGSWIATWTQHELRLWEYPTLRARGSATVGGDDGPQSRIWDACFADDGLWVATGRAIRHVGLPLPA